MKLMILGRSQHDPRYRGTERIWPHYVDWLPESHPANQAFLWWVNNGNGPDGIGFVNDMSRARVLIDEFAKLDPPEHFELIEATCDGVEPKLGGELLGYDVTELYHHSILVSGLPFDLEQHERSMEIDDEYREIGPMFRLFKEHFSGRLNEHVLFPERATADLCLECASILIQSCPDIFDMPRESLRIVALYSTPIV